MFNIAFRADGGKNVGMGHMMRCLSLAQSFQRMGHKVYFFSKLEEGIEKAEREKFNVIRLPSVEQETEGFFYGNPAQLADEAGEIIVLLNKYRIDILCIDTYNVNAEYFLAFRPHVSRLVYIDDVNKFPYPVDVVVNGNITGEYQEYRKYDEKQVLLLGPRYNLIRAEFCKLPARTVRENVEEIMITTGGSDPYNMTGKLLTMLLGNGQFNNLRFNVLVGSGFRDYQDLIKLKQRYDQVFLYANSALANNFPEIVYSEISPVMLRSDMAISAGGSTLYEFAACGTPVLAFIMAENQEFIVRKMDEAGYVKNLGWYNQIDEYQVIDDLQAIMRDYPGRQDMSRKGQRLVDGQGTERSVQGIIQDLKIN